MGLRSLQGNRLTAGVTFATGSGFLLFGYDQGVFGGLIENRSFQETFDYPSSMMVGHITATYDLGCFLGAIACMALGDYFGRRLSITLGCFILTVGAVLQASSYHSAQMIVGRFVAGVGNGINTTSIPVWQSEMSKPRHRGRLIVLQLALNQLGNVTAQWLNFGLGFIDYSSVSWRFPLAFQIFYALLAASATPWLPDSPRWLIQRNREPEARVVLARLYNKASTPDDPEITALHEASVRSVQHELELTAAINWCVLFRKDRLHTTRRILLGAGTQFMQQWGGINGISFAFVGGSLGAHTDQWSKVAMAFVFMFFTVFGLTWIAVPWMYPAEVNTQQWRNWGAGIATATNWICNYAVVLATPVGIERIAWRYYLIYAALNILFIPIVWVCYVETGGLSLEEVDEVFEKMGSSSGIDSGMELSSVVRAVDGQVEKDGALSEWVEHVRA
ncbi:hypothetical protein ETB97_006058 [Aspergillus alliaceus]|uniref:Major facilitator superfamily (MFS) profile domain-containing protein n=1 Tax=Petromyces alliaceus TaxID=209559 RepID=A0A8H5ZVR4_PETAA|nr:hypothetical protein ETB97_006058 [Aspergillus burnettii]